jgi:Tol biopolymer transport system component/tRNA A-37 threonylcarbamoyl transferase component Bud32
VSITCPKCRSDNPETLKFCGNCGTKLDASELGHPPSALDRASFTRTLETSTDEFIRGTTFAGRYVIIEALGEGGMGRVYRVHDTKLKEEVALKLIKPEIAAEKIVVERFQNEIKTARKIAHKNVCRMYDFHEEGKTLYLTMEYVRGEDLKSLLHRTKALTVGAAVSIARQVADGLAEAHKLGIVHRDLKPGNIMIDKDGQAKIMDFGIARVSQAKGLTGAGTIIGTPEYMSPEQVEGKDVDRRSDIYSLGVILYEMLTGRVPFEGDTPFAVAMKHKSEIPGDLREVNSQIPKGLSQLVLKCLEKAREKRYQTAEELRADLETVETGLPIAERAVPRRKPMTSKEITVKFSLRKLALPASVLIILLAVAGYFFFRRGPEIFEVKIGRTQQITHDPGLEIDPAISPDGKMIAYAAGAPGKMALFVRQVAGGRPVPLTASLPGDCRWPRWSPDGTQLSFQSQNSIFALPALGGVPKKLVEAAPGQMIRCAVWSPDGRQIAFGLDKSIFLLSLDGGEPRMIVETAYLYEPPYSLCWSSDGSKIAYVVGNRAFLFGSPFLGNIAPSSIWMVSSKGGHPVRVTDDKSLNVGPVFMPDGKHLLYVSNEKGGRDVYLLTLDASGEPLGGATRLTTGLNAHTISLSAAGDKLAYSEFTHTANIWSIRIPKDGPISISEAQPVTAGNQTIEGISVSRDGKWLAYDSNLNGNQDIYKVPIGGGEAEQLTSDPADDFLPAWSPDGREIAFYSWRKGNRDLALMMADGTRFQPLTDDPASEGYPDWSPDGRHLVFTSDNTGHLELFIISRENKDAKWGAPRQLTSDGADPGAKWSPDGRRIAYTWAHCLCLIPSEGGKPRILVESPDPAVLPAPRFPAWARDNGTVYYLAFDAERRASFWSVPVSGGKPKLLVRFDDPFRQTSRVEFATDGERFFFTLARYESDIWVGDLSISRHR